MCLNNIFTFDNTKLTPEKKLFSNRLDTREKFLNSRSSALVINELKIEFSTLGGRHEKEAFSLSTFHHENRNFSDG